MNEWDVILRGNNFLSKKAKKHVILHQPTTGRNMDEMMKMMMVMRLYMNVLMMPSI